MLKVTMFGWKNGKSLPPIIWLFSVGLSGAVSAGSHATCSVNFYPAPQTKEAIFDEFEGAVLRLESGEEQGTGYLVDSNYGYTFTAAHVVKASIKNSEISIIGTSPALPGSSLVLKHVANLWNNGKGVDLALLQVLNLGKIRHIRPLDIALYRPREGSELYVMGYPMRVRTPGIQSAEFIGVRETSGGTSVGGILQVKQSISRGDSGSPLIDRAGSVIGTAFAQVLGNPTLGYYIPTSHALTLLKRIPMSPRASVFDQKFRSGDVSYAVLLHQLKRTSWKMRNVELFSWAVHISLSLKEYVSPSTQRGRRTPGLRVSDSRFPRTRERQRRSRPARRP